LFGEYDQVNFGNDLTIKTKDALFYYQLGRGMYDSGFRNFDSISVDTYLSDKADTRKVFSAYGGYPEVEKLKSLVDVDPQSQRSFRSLRAVFQNFPGYLPL
jgi:hypothetical protein